MQMTIQEKRNIFAAQLREQRKTAKGRMHARLVYLAKRKAQKEIINEFWRQFANPGNLAEIISSASPRPPY